MEPAGRQAGGETRWAQLANVAATSPCLDARCVELKQECRRMTEEEEEEPLQQEAQDAHA